MDPAMRHSVLGIHFTKKQLTEPRKVWEDEAWEDMKKDSNSANMKGTDEEDEVDGNDEYGEDEVDEDEEYDEDEADEGDTYGEDEEGDIAGSDDDEKVEHHKDWATDESEDILISNAPSDVDKLAELAFRLSIFFITEGFTDGQPGSSLLVYYSGASIRGPPSHD